MVPRGLSLSKNFMWTFAGNLVYSACQWGMIVVLAKMGNPAMVGLFALSLAIISPVVSFSNLDLRAVLATDARLRFRFQDYFRLRSIMSVLAVLTILVIILAGNYNYQAILVIMIMSSAKAVEALSDIYYGLFQRHELMDLVAKSMMLKGIISLTLLAGGIFLSGKLWWGAMGLMASWIIVFLLYDLPKGRGILKSEVPLLKVKNSTIGDRPGFFDRKDGKVVLRLAWLALPVGLIMVLLSLSTNMPRYFIEGYWGPHYLGIFAGIAYFGIVGDNVVSALGKSASPRLAMYYSMGDIKAFRRLLGRLLVIGVALGILSIGIVKVAGPQILTLFYTPEYAAHADTLFWVMVASALMYPVRFLGNATTAMHRFASQVPIALFYLACISGFCYLLVRPYQIQGAAWSLLAGAIVCLSAYGVLVWRYLRLAETAKN